MIPLVVFNEIEMSPVINISPEVYSEINIFIVFSSILNIPPLSNIQYWGRKK